MKYIITIHDKNSPDYRVSSYHTSIGTGTVVCRDKDMAITILEKLIAMNKSINYINIQTLDDDGKDLWIYYWVRSRDGSDISFFKQKVNKV